MKLAHSYYVYIVRCSDGFYYTGVTNNVDKRVDEHNEGVNPSCYTYKRRPVVLLYYEHFKNIQNAIAFEKQLKGWSRKKKEAYMAGNYNRLQQLAKARKSLKLDSDDDPSASSW
jgi:putative endonuclease